MSNPNFHADVDPQSDKDADPPAKSESGKVKNPDRAQTTPEVNPLSDSQPAEPPTPPHPEGQDLAG